MFLRATAQKINDLINLKETVLILTTPGYLFFILNLFVNFMVSPKVFAAYHLFSNVAQKLHYTNHGINFFFYVISGQKFRTDLQHLFRRSQTKANVMFMSDNSRQVTHENTIPEAKS